MSLTKTEQQAIVDAYKLAQKVRGVATKLRNRPRIDSPYIDGVSASLDTLELDAFDFEQQVRRIAGENAIALPL